MKKGGEVRKCKMLYFGNENGNWSCKAKNILGNVLICFVMAMSNGVQVLT
jgi:hypothetical protein